MPSTARSLGAGLPIAFACARHVLSVTLPRTSILGRASGAVASAPVQILMRSLKRSIGARRWVSFLREVFR